MEHNTLKNYYKVLGLNRDATKTEIKVAFRKLAKTMHPDVCNEPDAKEKFQEISEAYEVLYNDDSRKKYDELLRAYMSKRTDAYKQHREFTQHEQRYARQKAREYSEMTYEDVMKIFRDVLLHGEKSIRKKVSLKTCHILGFRVFILFGLVSMMGTVILTIPAIYLISIVIKSFFYERRFVGIVPVIKGTILVFVEFITIAGIGTAIYYMLANSLIR